MSANIDDQMDEGSGMLTPKHLDFAKRLGVLMMKIGLEFQEVKTFEEFQLACKDFNDGGQVIREDIDEEYTYPDTNS